MIIESFRRMAIQPPPTTEYYTKRQKNTLMHKASIVSGADQHLTPETLRGSEDDDDDDEHHVKESMATEYKETMQQPEDHQRSYKTDLSDEDQDEDHDDEEEEVNSP
jgi:hypothetical protein